MNLIMLIFFILVGIAGLYYKVEAGVFISLGLIPWQILRMKINGRLNLIAIGVTGVVGSLFFIFIRDWTLLFLFIFIEVYNYWGYLRTQKTEEPGLTK